MVLNSPVFPKNFKPGDSCFIIGIAGTGTASLAIYLKQLGYQVEGSERDPEPDYAVDLTEWDIPVYSQGSRSSLNRIIQLAEQAESSRRKFLVIRSAAVEDSVLEVQTAVNYKIPLYLRHQMATTCFENSKKQLLIAGTAGKSSTAALICHLLSKLELAPSYILGARIQNYFRFGLARAGNPDSWFVFEGDESDGTVAKLSSDIMILTNVSAEHKPLNELIQIFAAAAVKCRGNLIANTDCPVTPEIIELANFQRRQQQRPPLKINWFKTPTLNSAELPKIKTSAKLQPLTANFNNWGEISINPPCRYNLSNYASALSAAELIIDNSFDSQQSIISSFNNFPGVFRRFELIGQINQIPIVSDYAHAPIENREAIISARRQGERLAIVYQPHGYGPLSRTAEETAVSFADTLKSADYLLISDVYYAGGTVTKTLESSDLSRMINQSLVSTNPKTGPQIQDCGDLTLTLQTAWKLAEQNLVDLVILLGARSIHREALKQLESITRYTTLEIQN